MQKSVFDAQGRYAGVIVRSWDFDPRPHLVGQTRYYWQAGPFGMTGKLEGSFPDTPEGIMLAKAHVLKRCEEIKNKLVPRRPPEQMRFL